MQEKGFTITSGVTVFEELPEVLLQIQRVRHGVILPTISEGNAGIDLRVLTQNNEPSVTIEPNGFYVFNTGIKMNIPSGYYIEIVPRSSMGIKRNLRIKNTVGVLDSSWKGETLVAVHNFGPTPVVVENNERLCQMIVHKVPTVSIVEVSDVGSSARGENGFGSTGRF